MKQKHSNRPNCLHNKTDLEPVYYPSTILIEFDSNPSQSTTATKIDENFNKELVELYFSNRKRSGGDNILKCVYDANKANAFITYEDWRVAKNVASRSHKINYKPVNVSLYYDKIGKDPLKQQKQTKINKNDSLSSSSNMSVSEQSGVNCSSTCTSASMSSDLSNCKQQQQQQKQHKCTIKKKISSTTNPIDEKSKIDTSKLLSTKQSNYLYELQNIYNEINDSKLKSSKKIYQTSNQKSKSNSKSVSTNQLNNENQLYYYPKSDISETLKSKSNSTRKSLPEFTSTISFNENSTSTAIATSLTATTKRSNLKMKTISTPSLKKLSSSTIKPQKMILQKERPPPPKLIKPDSTSSCQDDESTITTPYSIISCSTTNNKLSKSPKANSLINLNTNNNRTSIDTSTTSDEISMPIIKSIVKNKSSIIKQTTIKFSDNGKVSLPGVDARPSDLSNSSSSSSSGSGSENECILDSNTMNTNNTNSCDLSVNRPLVSINNGLRSVCSRTSNKFYKANLAKRNLQSFYGPTSNESLNKLTLTQIEFIQTTRYLNKLKTLFPKVNINLNEKMRNLYFFGTTNQVVEAKMKVKLDLDAIKQSVYEIEHKELAEYLKKPDPRQKILKFIESIINKHQYQRMGKNKINIENKSVNFCSYQIEQIKKRGDHASKDVLVVSTNLDNMSQFLHKLLTESIRVNQLINIYNTNIVRYILNDEQQWLEFYDAKFKNNVDFSLIKNDCKDSNWSLKITGFKEYVDKFIIDFRNKFD